MKKRKKDVVEREIVRKQFLRRKIVRERKKDLGERKIVKKSEI